jgi:hypothetical protein
MPKLSWMEKRVWGGSRQVWGEGRSCSSVLAPPLACADRSNTVYQLTKKVDDNLSKSHVDFPFIIRYPQVWFVNSGRTLPILVKETMASVKEMPVSDFELA